MNIIIFIITFFVGFVVNASNFESYKLSGDSLKVLKEIGQNVKVKKENKNEIINLNKTNINHVNISANEEKKDKIHKVSKGNMVMQLTAPSSGSENDILVDKAIELAYRAYKSGQTAAALNLYGKILRQEPKHVDALFGSALIMHQDGNLLRAKQNYAKILEINPKHMQAINNYLAIIASQASNESLREIRKIQALNPNLSIIPAQIATIYLKQNKHKKAIKSMIKAINIEPNNREYQYNLALIFDKFGYREDAMLLYGKLLKNGGESDVFSIEEVSDRLEFLTNE